MKKFKKFTYDIDKYNGEKYIDIKVPMSDEDRKHFNADMVSLLEIEEKRARAFRMHDKYVWFELIDNTGWHHSEETKLRLREKQKLRRLREKEEKAQKNIS